MYFMTKTVKILAVIIAITMLVAIFGLIKLVEIIW